MSELSGQTEATVTCFCGSPMILRETKKFTYKSGRARKFWGCSRWPDCDGVVGAHPTGAPAGTPADHETKQARIKAHAAFDKLWKGGQMKRASAYKRLAVIMEMEPKDAHIGHFTKEQCETLVERLAATRAKKRGIVEGEINGTHESTEARTPTDEGSR